AGLRPRGRPTQGVLARRYLWHRATGPPVTMRLAMLGWLAFAIGILIKGPILPAVLAVTVVAVSLADHPPRDGMPWSRYWRRLGEGFRWLRGLHPWWGLLLTLVVALPWGIAIGIESQGLFYEQSLGQDFAMKIAEGQETHGAP